MKIDGYTDDQLLAKYVQHMTYYRQTMKSHRTSCTTCRWFATFKRKGWKPTLKRIEDK